MVALPISPVSVPGPLPCTSLARAVSHSIQRRCIRRSTRCVTPSVMASLLAALRSQHELREPHSLIGAVRARSIVHCWSKPSNVLWSPHWRSLNESRRVSCARRGRRANRSRHCAWRVRHRARVGRDRLGRMGPGASIVFKTIVTPPRRVWVGSIPTRSRQAPVTARCLTLVAAGLTLCVGVSSQATPSARQRGARTPDTDAPPSSKTGRGSASLRHRSEHALRNRRSRHAAPFYTRLPFLDLVSPL